MDGGKLSGGVYTVEEGHWEFIGEVLKKTITSNPLHFGEFPYVCQFEAEIIRSCLDLHHGTKEQCGVTSSGGSESIFLAMLAYREWGRKERGITKPNIVLSNTAHAAFNKACFYLQIEIRKVPIKKDTSCDLKGIRNAIDSNTVALVASCPEYAFGNFDPVDEISKMALRKGIGLHIDACLGSFVNPFIEEAGFKRPCIFDFRNKGITSISCDPHKYGCGPKGLSVCMFRSYELRRNIMFAVSNW